MAQIKQNPLIPDLSGKIGGQSIARSQRVNYIRNITQTNTAGTLKQKKQRFNTAHLTSLYKTLTSRQKGDWSTASLNYNRENRKGEIVTRNGYDTFLFINQNKILIGETITSTPPTFTKVNTPFLSTDSMLDNELELGTNIKPWSQTYIIFAFPYLGGGETMNFGKGVIVGQVTQSQLEAKIDILPLIKIQYPAIIGDMTIGFYLAAIVTANGNRAQFPTMHQERVINIS